MNTESSVDSKFLEFFNRDKAPFDYEKTLFNDHHSRVIAILKGESPPPYEIEIQPSSICNLNCKHCFGKVLSSSKLSDRMGIEELKIIAKNIACFKDRDFCIETVKFCGTTGEPLVNPVTVYGIKMFKQLGKKVIIYTNGLLLDKKSSEGKEYMDYILEADKINLSLDAGLKETFHLLKGVDGFEKTIKNLKELIKRKKKTGSKLRIDVSYVIGQDNYHDIVEAAKLMKEIGVNELIFRVDFINPKTISILSKEIISKIEEAKSLTDKKFRIQSAYTTREISDGTCAFTAKGRKCFNHHFWACIGPDCNLYACGHRTYCGVESYGNVIKNNIQELWQSKNRRSKVESLPDNPCKFCSPSSLRRNEFMTFLYSLPIEKVKELHEKYVVQAQSSEKQKSKDF